MLKRKKKKQNKKRNPIAFSLESHYQRVIPNKKRYNRKRVRQDYV